MKVWLTRILVVLGLLCFSAAVWFAAPLVGFGESQPFAPVWVRIAIIAVAWLIAFVVWLIRFLRARKAEAALEDAVAGPKVTGDADQLGERMTEALAVLKKSSGSRQYLYDLPWYVIIGPPGAGKTTALLNSGIKFPLSEKTGGAVAGVGGTRYCDWWFAEEAVMIDTAGRYTTQDSDKEADSESWSSFLGLLKRNRPKQPINGVIVAIGLDEVLSGTEETLDRHAEAIRARLMEIHETLKIEVPVYVLFTKADLVAGFTEFFGSFSASRRQKVWGATFQTESRKEQTVGLFGREYDALVSRLSEEVTDRLQEEPDPVSRIQIFGFPGQVAMLRERLQGLVTSIFESSRYRVNANLRGFYFSSGTQEGTPIDQVLGEMERSFGAMPAGAMAGTGMSGKGKSFFLHDLLARVIFAESGWVSYDRRAVRRGMLMRGAAFGALALVTLGLLGVWGMSYYQNRQLIATADAAVMNYASVARDELAKTEIQDPDPSKVAGYLQMLRTMPTGYAGPDGQGAFLDGYGLAVEPRLHSAAVTSYHLALERMLRPRLIMGLEQQLTDFIQKNDTLSVYEALKVYKLLGDAAPKPDDKVVLAWFNKEWKTAFPLDDSTRQQLMDHLKAMLTLDTTGRTAVGLNGALVDQAERMLARMSVADQAYLLVNGTAEFSGVPDFNVAQRAGADSDKVFETVDGSDFKSLTVPGLYTYRGFHDFFLPQLAQVAQKIEDDQWVMGDYAKQADVEDQIKRLGPELMNRYTNDFIAAWNRVLTNIKFRPMAADKPNYTTLGIASAPRLSPIFLLMQAIDQETRLTRAFADDGDGGGGAAGSKVAALAAQAKGGNGAVGMAASELSSRALSRTSGLARVGLFIALNGGKSQNRAGGGGGAQPLPGAAIEANFAAYHDMFEGPDGQRTIDQLLAMLDKLHTDVILSATSPAAAAQQISLDVGNLKSKASSRLPDPLGRMVNQLADDFASDATNASLADLNAQLQVQVTQQCQKIVQNTYPFSRRSSRDVQMIDFARIFAPGGVMDRFFSQYLVKYADISGKDWKWRAGDPLGSRLSTAALREFQRAAEIRAAFFPSGSNIPGVELTIAQTAIHNDVQAALLEINGQTMTTRQQGNVAQKFTWPGGSADGSASVQFAPELQGRDSVLAAPRGPWALYRFVKMGHPRISGREVQVQYTIGGRYIAYSIQVGALVNLFGIRSLSDFQCPTGL
ncbi:type VI secretion system membrane subunit TssM [Acidimangrovimonas sediminis]|uniref:type VI secretion system membrane subunit TssM n=1 Tax=Acidimangrovimonas sediminis TaxID=2056283 RepID=UPI000C7FBC67|nr:type VI secretion system membrane subunit TssM [Acidimangrovimonas sediminis]